MKLFIKGAVVVDKTSAFKGKKVDIQIENGQISRIGQNLEAEENIEVYDAGGLKISQGWVDVGTHFKDPGFEWLEDLNSISEAAAYGGFTQLIGFPNTLPVIQTKEAISYFKNFNQNNLVQLLNLAAVTKDCKGEDFTDMIDLKVGGATGYSDGKNAIQNSDIFLKSLLYLQALNTVLVVKSEDKYLSMYGQMHEGISSTALGLKGIPSAGEELMIMRNLKLLEYSEVKSDKPLLHFSTISTSGSVQLIREAKAKGLPVSCDVAAHHLIFTDEDMMTFDTNLKVYPPFRAKQDIEALKTGLEDATIDFIVSDHNSWDEEHKTLEFGAAEFGAVGLQTVFPAALQKLDLETVIDKISFQPRKVFNLPLNGFEAGSLADFTIFDDKDAFELLENSIKSKGKNSPFKNQKLMGKAKAVFNNSIFKILD